MKKLLTGAALLLMSAAAGAQDKPGFYLGGHFGQAMYQETCEGFTGSGVSCDDKDSAWRILAGYQVNRNFAAEFAYTNFGEARASGPGGTASAEAAAFEFVGIGMLPVANNFSLYGKLGVYRGEVDVHVNTSTVVGSISESNTDLTFGFGARFDFTPQIAGRLEWQRYGSIGGGDVGEDDIDVISIGVLFKF